MNKLRLALSFALAWARTLWIPLFAIVLFVSTLALAQTQAGVVLRGDALKRREFQTYSGAGSTGNYVVNTSGASTNSCLGQQGCAQLNDVFRKLPSRIRHNIVIDIDAGTYTDQAYLSGLSGVQLDAGFPTVNDAPSIRINGSQNWTAVTPATGTSTGTVTSYVAESGSTATTLCDTGQAWTVDELKGVFVGMTSGSVSSVTGKMPIISNTATCLRLPASLGAVVAGNTYALLTPSTILITSGTRPAFAIQSLKVPTFMQDVWIQSSAAGSGWMLIADSQGDGFSSNGFTCTRCRFTNTVAASPAITVNNATVSLSRVSATSIRSALVQISGLPTTSVNFSGTYIYGQVNAAAAIGIVGGNLGGSGLTVESTGAGALGIDARFNSSPVYIVATGIWRFIFPAASTGAGIYMGAAGTTTSVYSGARLAYTTLVSENGLAVALSGQGVSMGGIVSNPTLLVSGATTGISVSEGAQCILSTGGSYTFTSVTNQLLLDTQAYTYSTLSGAGQISNARGSAFLE